MIVVLAVFLVLADKLTGGLEWKARLFRFNKKVWIVTGALRDRQGNYDMPYYDHKAAELIAEILGSVGVKSQIDHCKSRSLPRNFGENLILICGPVMNEFSAEINKRLQGETAWFNGFYFESHDASETESPQTPEKTWSIRHRGITDINIPFAGFPAHGVAEDCGLIYVGPNPINSHNWLIWAAGLGPIATYGAANAFGNPILLELLGRGLFNKQRYASALIQYCFDPDNPVDGSVSSILVTGGTVT